MQVGCESDEKCYIRGRGKSAEPGATMQNMTFDRTEAEFRENPVLFVELVHDWSAGGSMPASHHESWLRQLPRPIIATPSMAREALWGALSYPERARSLAWLHRMGILEELLPSWAGDETRQALRMNAVEEVHLERWAEGLSKPAFDWLCVNFDQKVENRLGGWALTGLATLLLTGDEPADSFALRVEADLKQLGAKPGECERVVTAIREFPLLEEALRTNHLPPQNFSPTGIVAAISTLFAQPGHSEDRFTQAIKGCDLLLLRFAAPENGPSRKKKK
jgi:hypothetical protein